MERKVLVLSTVLVMTMLVGSAALAGEETVFSGNLRFKYDNPKGKDDTFTVHCLELKVKKQVGAFGVFLNERIGGTDYNDLYEGWASYKAPGIGTFRLGRVPVPFGIHINGLYAPKGILWDAGWMCRFVYGASYDSKFPLSEALGVDVGAAFFKNGFYENERNTVSGRVGVDLSGPVGVKAGGSVQMGTLKEDADPGYTEDETKLGIGGDVTISPAMLPIPVSVLGEFVNYSLGEDDTRKGNIMMGQLDVTPIKEMGVLDAAKLSLHVGMDMPTEGKSVTNLIAQLKLTMGKQFNIFAQVFGDMVEDADEMSGQGIRVWFMYVF